MTTVYLVALHGQMFTQAACERADRRLFGRIVDPDDQNARREKESNLEGKYLFVLNALAQARAHFVFPSSIAQARERSTRT